MKTIQHYLDTLDKTKYKYVNVEDILNELQLPYVGYPFTEDHIPEFKGYRSDYQWYCTDRNVGLCFYFLNDEFVCASMQIGRKCDEEFEWVSKDIFNKVRDYFLNKLIQHIKHEETNFAQLDLNQQLQDYFITKSIVIRN